MKCEQLKWCTFFDTLEVGENKHLVETLKHAYCNGNPMLCARRRIAKAIGRENVPANIQPDHMHLVQHIIEASLRSE